MTPSNQTPTWLRTLERKLSWLAIPNIAILIVTLQVMGFLLVTSDPIWIGRLALIPDLVRQGEFWRLITFLSLPLSTGIFWVIFGLWFLYFIIDAIEQQWGSFKTTLYILTSILLTILVSFLLDHPVAQATDFESTLFLAAATLFPDFEIRLFFAIPVKMKWMAWFSIAFLVLRFIQSDTYERIYLFVIYSNYLLFFGPALYQQLKQIIRRQNYKRKLR